MYLRGMIDGSKVGLSNKKGYQHFVILIIYNIYSINFSEIEKMVGRFEPPTLKEISDLLTSWALGII